MMNFKQWQVINETYGRFALGVKSPRSVGAVGSKLSELGLTPGDMADDLSGGDPGMDDLGGDPSMGGMDDLGGDPGMGGMDDLGMGDDLGGDPGMGLGMGGMGGGKITIDDLDPSLLALLGLGKLAKQMGQPSPFGDEGDEDLEGGEFGSEEPDGDEGMPFGDGDGDEAGEAPEGDEGGSPFGDEGEGDEGEGDGGEDGIPFGGPSGSGSPSKDSDGDGETDDVDDDDDGDGETDDVDDDDDNDGVPDKADKDKKKCDSGKNSKVQYQKKFMGKGGMKGCCNNEDNAFLNSLTSMGRGNVHQTFESGMPRPQTQKRRLEPKAGDIGYAPQSRVGQNWPSVREWNKNKSK